MLERPEFQSQPGFASAPALGLVLCRFSQVLFLPSDSNAHSPSQLFSGKDRETKKSKAHTSPETGNCSGLDFLSDVG